MASRRLRFAKIGEDLEPKPIDYPPHINYRPPKSEELAEITTENNSDWADGRIEKAAVAYAAAKVVSDHFEERCTPVVWR